jgi:hypothetical protein
MEERNKELKRGIGKDSYKVRWEWYQGDTLNDVIG